MTQKLSYLLIFVFMLGCKSQTTDIKSEGEKLMQLSKDWSKTAGTGNTDSTLSYWADDAVVMSPGQPTLVGKQAIRGMVEGTSKIPGFRISWEPKSVSFSDDGKMAYMIEESQVTMNDSLGRAFTEYNKGVTIWRKDANGNWKNVVDIWNANPALIK